MTKTRNRHRLPSTAPTWLLLCLAATVFASSAVAKEIWIIAGSEDELTQTEARELILDGKYKMTKVTVGELTRAILYNEIAELADYLPAEAIEQMTRPPEYIDPDAGWIDEFYPPFDFAGLDSEPIRQADLKGRVVVLNYWFIGCVPCVREMPTLNELATSYAEQPVSFIAATFDEAEKVRSFLAENPFSYRQGLTDLDHLAELGVSSYPTHVVIGRDGKVRGYMTGLSGGLPALRKELSDSIDQALAEP